MRRDEQQKQDLLWVIIMMITAMVAVLLAGSALFDFTLPDTLMRIIGGIGLIALPFAALLTVRKAKAGK